MAVKCHQELFSSQTRPTCFWIRPSLFWLRPSMFRVRPSHFSSQSFSLFQSVLPTFSTQTFPFFFRSVLPTFPSQYFSFFESEPPIFLGQSFPFFQVRPSHFIVKPSHFFVSFLPILFRKLLLDYFESILQFMGLIKRCLTWDANGKYIFQWRNWFWGDINK